MQQLIQGVLAAICLVGLFGLVILQQVQRPGTPIATPEILNWVTISVISFIFGQRAVTSGIHAATNGVATLAQKIGAPNGAQQPGSTTTTTTTVPSDPTPGGDPHAPQG